MAFRVEIGLKRGLRDPRGESVVARARGYLGLNAHRCITRDVYLVDADLDPAAQASVRDAFADAVVARAALGRLPPPARYDWLIEVGFKPGVTDNVGHTARCVLADLLDRPSPAEAPAVYTSIQYFLIAPGLDRGDARRLAEGVLANPLILPPQPAVMPL